MGIDLGKVGSKIRNEDCKTLEEEGLFALPSISIIRTVVEGQFLAKRLHLSRLGVQSDPNTSKLIVVGGAAVNRTLLQVSMYERKRERERVEKETERGRER